MKKNFLPLTSLLFLYMGMSSILFSQEPCFDENYIQNPFGIFENPVSTLVKLADIDHDGEIEAFVSLGGSGSDKVKYYENDGSNSEPQFMFKETDPFGFDSDGLRPFQFVDIDHDGLHELFIGRFDEDLPILMIDNTGTESEPYFGSDPIPNPYGINLPESELVSGDLLDAAFPAFVDIDNDGDHDVFISGLFPNNNPDEQLFFMENKDTTPNRTSPIFDSVEVNPFGFDFPLTEKARLLIFTDLDCDSDFDMYMSTVPANDIFYFENTGTLEEANFSGGILSSYGDPFSPPGGDFLDLGADGDMDLLNGSLGAGVQLYENITDEKCGMDFENCVTNVQENKIDIRMAIFPNPVQDIFLLSLQTEKALGNIDLEIFDSMGRLAFSKVLETVGNELSEPLDINHLFPGVYFLKIQVGGKAVTRRFVKAE